MRIKIKYILIILFLIFSLNIVQSKNNLSEYLIPTKIYDDNIVFGKNFGKTTFILRKAIKVNLTNSGHDEYIAFYYRPEKKRSDESFYECIKVYVLDNLKIIKQYRIEHVSYMNYNTDSEYDLKMIKELEQYFGSWNGYFYVYDLNGNGYQEIFLYGLGGIGGGFSIWEYNNDTDKFKPIIKLEDTLRFYRLIINKKAKSFIYFEQYESRAYEYRYVGVKYTWSDKLKKYEKCIVKSGLTFEEVSKINNL